MDLEKERRGEERGEVGGREERGRIGEGGKKEVRKGGQLVPCTFSRPHSLPVTVKNSWN